MKLGKVRYESKYLAVKHFYEDKKWSVNWMCKQLGISKAGYYKWLHRDIPAVSYTHLTLPTNSRV